MLKNKHLTALIFMFVGLVGFSQTTINLQEFSHRISNEIAFTEVTRIIDDDNSLSPYLGQWQAIDNNQNTITFFISKVTVTYVEDTVIDCLNVDYTIVDSGGQLIFDNRITNTGVTSSFKGEHFNERGVYIGIWSHEDSEDSFCGTIGSFHLRLTRPLNGTTVIEFTYWKDFFFDMAFEDECPNGDEYPLLDKENILTFNKI
jgi:hypothetical protein